MFTTWRSSSSAWPTWRPSVRFGTHRRLVRISPSSIACANWGRGRCVVSARRNRPRHAGWLCRQLAPRRHRLHGRCVRQSRAGPGRAAQHSGQYRFTGHDQSVGGSGTGTQHYAANQPGLWSRAQSENQYGRSQSKHGIWHEQVDDCLRRADRYGLIVSGVHMHIGSGTDLEHLSQVCAAMESTCRNIGRTVTTISAGGGLPVPYRPSKPMSISIDTMRSGMRPQPFARSLRSRCSYGDRTRSLPGCRKRLSGGRDPHRQANGTEHVLSARRGL